MHTDFSWVFKLHGYSHGCPTTFTLASNYLKGGHALAPSCCTQRFAASSMMCFLTLDKRPLGLSTISKAWRLRNTRSLPTFQVSDVDAQRWYISSFIVYPDDTCPCSAIAYYSRWAETTLIYLLATMVISTSWDEIPRCIRWPAFSSSRI